MRPLVIVALVLMACATRVGVAAESAEPAQGIELMQLLESSAERLKKRFIVDPRARGQILLVNIDPKRITYQELQAILAVHGWVATQEIEGTVRIVPDANARQLPMPILDGDDKNIGDEEIVTQTIDVGTLQATTLVPVLRPLLPQYAHLVAHGQTNTLIVVARRANVRMIESIVRELKEKPSRDVKE